MDSLRPVFIVGTGKGLNANVTYYRGIDAKATSRPHPFILRKQMLASRPHKALFIYAGMQAVVAIFGIAWMGDTFIAGNMTEFKGSIEHVVMRMPWLFGLALFVMSILLFSQAATIRALLPLGIALGISPYMLNSFIPRRKRLFLHPKLPDSRSRHQLRPHGHDSHR